MPQHNVRRNILNALIRLLGEKYHFKENIELNRIYIFNKVVTDNGIHAIKLFAILELICSYMNEDEYFIRILDKRENETILPVIKFKERENGILDVMETFYTNS